MYRILRTLFLISWWTFFFIGLPAIGLVRFVGWKWWTMDFQRWWRFRTMQLIYSYGSVLGFLFRRHEVGSPVYDWSFLRRLKYTTRAYICLVFGLISDRQTPPWYRGITCEPSKTQIGISPSSWSVALLYENGESR